MSLYCFYIQDQQYSELIQYSNVSWYELKHQRPALLLLNFTQGEPVLFDLLRIRILHFQVLH